jgi:hypothetical protein
MMFPSCRDDNTHGKFRAGLGYCGVCYPACPYCGGYNYDRLISVRGDVDPPGETCGSSYHSAREVGNRYEQLERLKVKVPTSDIPVCEFERRWKEAGFTEDKAIKELGKAAYRWGREDQRKDDNVC